ELATDLLDVALRRPLGDEQPGCDFPVRQPLGDEDRHLTLALGEIGGGYAAQHTNAVSPQVTAETGTEIRYRSRYFHGWRAPGLPSAWTQARCARPSRRWEPVTARPSTAGPAR